MPVTCYVSGALESVPLTGEKNSTDAHKTGSRYLLGVLFQIFDKHLGRYTRCKFSEFSDHAHTDYLTQRHSK